MKNVILSLTWIGWQAEFEIDLEKANPACKESLDFFGDPITREDDTPEENVKAFLQFWGPFLARWSDKYLGDVESVIKETKNWEGIFPLDGTHGIKLVYCDRFELSHDDFEVAIGKEAA